MKITLPENYLAVTKDAIRKFSPSFSRPARIKSHDPDISTTMDGKILFIVSGIENGKFLAFLHTTRKDNFAFYHGLREWDAEILSSYHFCQDDLPKIILNIKPDSQGRLIAFGEDGLPITSSILSDGITIEIPSLSTKF